MVYLLFDYPNKNGKTSFLSQQSRFEIKEVYSPKFGGGKIAGWLKGCREAFKASRRDDTIVCWYDFQAVLCFWLCKFTLKRRKIVCINLLLKEKDSFKNKVVTWLYKKALNGKCFVASVTSVEYGEHLRKRLGVEKKFHLLHDVFRNDYRYGDNVTVRPNTVFCGGKNGRDWLFMVEVAKAMPEVEFHLVMPEATYQELKDDFPRNVVAKHNIPIEEFLRELCASEIVALPLDTEAPAGLIVLFQAAANRKYIITTDTMTTREYLTEGRGSLIANNVDGWVAELNKRLSNNENCISSSRMLEFLQSECSEEGFVDGIERMINDLK